MGSSGYGKFGDIKSGQEPTKEMCMKDIESTGLEEIGRMEYYSKNNDVPSIMELVRLSETLENGRLVVVLDATGEKIGLLPSRYSSLLVCMRKGFSYNGHVVFSSLTPFPRVEVTLDAKE
jgi:hypothetical protein